MGTAGHTDTALSWDRLGGVGGSRSLAVHGHKAPCTVQGAKLFPSWFLTGEKGMDFAAVFPPGGDALHAQGCLFLTRLCPGGGGHPAAPRVRQSSPRSSVRGGTGRNPESRKCPKTRLFPLFPGCLLQNWNELPKKKSHY